MPLIVADTSPLFYLARLNLLSVLRELYGEIHIPFTVWTETLAGRIRHPLLLPQFHTARDSGWLVISPNSPPILLPEIDGLDAGERDALALAKFLHADLILMDERFGRSAAGKIGLSFIGTLGVLAAAKRAGLIPFLKPVFCRLRAETNFRFSIALENAILTSADESS